MRTEIPRAAERSLRLKDLDAVVVGGGPAGLAVSQQLGARGLSSVVLERGERAGWTWRHLYDSLRLHTGKHLSSLPGMPFPRRTPLFPSRLEFVEYLDSYAARFRLPVHTGVEATGLRQEDGGWLVETSYGEYRAKAVVVATGIASEPKLPEFDGMSSYGGQMSHSSEYRAPDQSPARSILIVGIGNSGAEIASELAEAGRDVTLSVRSGANIIPRSIVGIPTQYFGWLLSALPSALQRRVTRELSRLGDLVRPGSARLPRKRAPDSCQDVPVIGRRILDLIGAGRVKKRPGIAEMNTHGVRFLDGESWTGDAIVLATGYRGAIEWMGRYGDRDECGFGERRDRVRSSRHAGLYFMGHNYDGRGGLYNIRIDAKRVARLVSESHTRR